MRSALHDARVAAGAPGAILEVRDRDGLLVQLQDGEAVLAPSRPIDASEPFYLGSISKTYTAALILLLHEDSALDLGDPVSRFLPDFPRGNEITIDQLLRHTSGLRDFYLYLYLRPDRDEMIEAVTRDYSQDEMLELAGRFGHWFDPGTDWAYSNTNYFLLGVIAERAIGMPLHQAYRERLLDPLGLNHTWLTLYESAPAGELTITGYMGTTPGWEHSAMFGELGPTTVIERSNLEWGAGGLAAPAGEALAFLDALTAGEVVNDDSLELMLSFTPTPPLGADENVAQDQETGYGLGIVRMLRANYEAIGHGGLFAGHTAGLWHLPRCGLTVAVYMNRGFIGQRATLDRIVEALEATGREGTPVDC